MAKKKMRGWWNARFSEWWWKERKLVRRWLTDEKSFMWFRGQRYEAGESREFVWLRKSGREDEL